MKDLIVRKGENISAAEIEDLLHEIHSIAAAAVIGLPDADRAVVLTGAGKAFSAGGNIPSFIRSYEDAGYRRFSLRQARRPMDAMAEFPQPVVAAVNGPAVGLGCSVALGCDMVYMAESAYFADAHVSIGLVAGDGGAACWSLFTSVLCRKRCS